MLLSNKSVRLGTLGPAGTSSEHALQYYANKFLLGSEYDYLLFNTFAQVLMALVKGDIMMAIVPHAYQEINKFYINPETKLEQMFIYKTPSYGLFKNYHQPLPVEHVKIAFHSAPILLMKYFSDTKMIPNEYQLELVDSTSIAARMVSLY